MITRLTISNTNNHHNKPCNSKNKMEQIALYLPTNTAHSSPTNYHSPAVLRTSRAFPYPSTNFYIPV
jgi:hypothetical protein